MFQLQSPSSLSKCRMSKQSKSVTGSVEWIEENAKKGIFAVWPLHSLFLADLGLGAGHPGSAENFFHLSLCMPLNNLD